MCNQINVNLVNKWKLLKPRVQFCDNKIHKNQHICTINIYVTYNWVTLLQRHQSHLRDLKLLQYSTITQISGSKLTHLADTTLPRSFKLAFTEAVNTYSVDTTGSLLPIAIQKPSKLQNCPVSCGTVNGCFNMLSAFTCPRRCCLMRDCTAGWDERSNCVKKLKQKPCKET